MHFERGFVCIVACVVLPIGILRALCLTVAQAVAFDFTKPELTAVNRKVEA